MHKRLIIFGAGRNGDDAYHFFGRENILCFVDNNEKMVGTKLHDKKRPKIRLAWLKYE